MSGDRYNWYAVQGISPRDEAKRVFGEPGRAARSFPEGNFFHDRYVTTVDDWVVVYAYGNLSLQNEAIATSQGGRYVLFVHSETIVSSSFVYALRDGEKLWAVGCDHEIRTKGALPGVVSTILARPLDPEDYGRAIGETLVGFSPEAYRGQVIRMAARVAKVRRVMCLNVNDTAVEKPSLEGVHEALDRLEPGKRVRLELGPTRITASFVDGKLALESCEPARYVTDEPLALAEVKTAFAEFYRRKSVRESLRWRRAGP